MPVGPETPVPSTPRRRPPRRAHPENPDASSSGLYVPESSAFPFAPLAPLGSTPCVPPLPPTQATDPRSQNARYTPVNEPTPPSTRAPMPPFWTLFSGATHTDPLRCLPRTGCSHESSRRATRIYHTATTTTPISLESCKETSMSLSGEIFVPARYSPVFEKRSEKGAFCTPRAPNA